MWDHSVTDPLYHYNVVDDGLRPYDLPMAHDITTGNPVLENDYFFVSHEDTMQDAGFYFPEMDWAGRLALTLNLK